MNETQHAIRLGTLLVVLWIVLSGHFAALLLFLGAGSCALALFIALRMDRVDGEAIPLAMRAGAWIRYTGWLGVEIVKSNLAVARVLVDPRLPIRPCVFQVDATQRSLLGHVVFANSITLTPGTVSIDLHGDAIDVHSLLEPDLGALGEMDRRVSAMERSP
ncbi:MAG: Na+/H+ antiporter subunit E [Immundisolibacterales bacterium]|nr:Na+/H+ antiporter subunit E [Immundisolibacterales bacterium]